MWSYTQTMASSLLRRELIVATAARANSIMPSRTGAMRRRERFFF